MGLGGAGAAHAEARRCQPGDGSALEKAAREPAPLEVLRGPGFGLLRDAEGTAEIACAPASIAQTVLLDRIGRASGELGVDPELVVLVSTSPVSCSAMYYLPIANDIQGIGYAHTEGQEIFDSSPDSAIEGIAFLNDWPYWQARPEEFRGAFNHELAHRWGARVHVQLDGIDSSELLGREQSHWSYFLSTGGSPHEGNVWAPEGSRFVSDTPRYPWQFSTLDLYLMGVAPAALVAPVSLLRAPDVAGVDCRGASRTSASPPQGCARAELEAEPIEVAIDDIVAVEGTRVPAAVAVRSVDVLVLILESARAPLERDGCEALSASLLTRFEDFQMATHGRVSLRNVLPSDGDAGSACAGLERPMTPAVVESAQDAGCQMSNISHRNQGACSAFFATLVVVLRLRRPRRRVRVHPS